MGIRRRPDGLLGAMACCRIVLVFFFCVCILVATTDAVKGASAATSAAAGGGRWTELTAGSPARYSAGGLAGADVFRDSKRRIPKGPDPIHNRRAGKTTIAPRRRD